MMVQHILKEKLGNDVFAVLPTATVGDAAKLLSERRIGAVMVGDDPAIPLEFCLSVISYVNWASGEAPVWTIPSIR